MMRKEPLEEDSKRAAIDWIDRLLQRNRICRQFNPAILQEFLANTAKTAE
jgi:hypothetical protein